MKKAGIKIDFKTGELIDKDGNRWAVVSSPHTWMYPPLSRAMETYYRLTGDEYAHDWTVAYGQAAARLLYQHHGAMSYGAFLGDFPLRGVFKDYGSWVTDRQANPYAEGVKINGFKARFHPDVCARAYTLTGEQFLKERGRDFWWGGTHRGYNAPQMTRPLDAVAWWLNYRSDHDGQVEFVGRTFYEWAHPRKDAEPPAAVKDLAVKLLGDGKAEVSFTMPADNGGQIARIQFKWAAQPIVDYVAFLDRFNAHQDMTVCNWWMASNVTGESVDGAAGERVKFVVTGVPEGATHFAVRTFDDSRNRSAISNVAQAN
jgi:hypothetical protein